MVKGKWGRPKGFKQSVETKSKISKAVKLAFLRAKEAEKEGKAGV